MQNKSILIILITLIFAASITLKADDEAITISPKWQNYRPTVTYNSSTNEFFVCWVQTEEVLNYQRPTLISGIIAVDPVLKKIRAKKIPRNNNLKTWTPWVNAGYNPALDIYYVVWQDISKLTGEKRLILTTFSSEGKFLRKAIILAVTSGFLLEKPHLVNVPGTEDVIALWNEFGKDGFSSRLMKFNVGAPHSSPKIISIISEYDKTFEMVKSIIQEDTGFSLFGYSIKLSKERNLQIFKYKLDEYLNPADKLTTATKKNIRESSTLFATKAKKGEIVLYDQSYPGKEKGNLAVFNFPASEEIVRKPFAIKGEDTNIFRGKLLDQAFDGKHRIFWLEKNEAGGSSIKFQSLALKGKPFGKPVEIASSANNITGFDLCYGEDKAAVLIVWSEDIPQSDPEETLESKIKVKYIDISKF